MGIFEVSSVRGGLSDYEDKGIPGAFKWAANIDIRKIKDSLSAGQALTEEGTMQSSSSMSPSSSYSPSASSSPSISASISPSSSVSPSGGGSSSTSPSASKSPSASVSPSASLSPSNSLSSSPSPSAGLTTIFSDLIIKFVKCSDGSLYGFGQTGKIYKRPAQDYWIQVYDLHKRLTGASEKPSFGGKTYLEFATGTELHRKEIPGLSSWNDVDATGTVRGDEWPKTNLDQEDWHMMEQVGGDVIIANGSKLAMSAYDDSYTNEALDLIPGNIAKTIIERSGRAVVGTYRASEPTKGVNAAIDSEVPLAQIGDDGYIYYNDFKNSISVKRFPGGGKVNPGGVANEVSQATFFDWTQTALSWIDKQVVGNMALFGVFGADAGKGGLYTFGRKNKNQPFVLNCEYQFDVDEIGAVVNVNGTNLMSYRSGTTFGVKAVDFTNKAIGIYQSLDFKAPAKYPIQITEWEVARLIMAPLPAGCAVEFWYRMNKTGNFVRAMTAKGDSQYNIANSKVADFRIGATGEYFEYQIILYPHANTTAEIFKTRCYFK